MKLYQNSVSTVLFCNPIGKEEWKWSKISHEPRCYNNNGERGFVLSGGGKHRRIVEVRSLLCCWALREPGVSLFSLSRKPGISVHSVSNSVARGQRIVGKRHLFLTKPKNSIPIYDYFAISVRTVYRLIDEGDLKRTKIRAAFGCRPGRSSGTKRNWSGRWGSNIFPIMASK
jgi:hypothetical protein